MELELGLKLTKVIDDFTSGDLLIAKDRGGPLFFTRETDSMFILTAHLKGFRKRNIKIAINEDGTQIAISGEKAVEEMVLVGWKMYKKEVEIRRFRKVFRIPNGVRLDKIKAKFSEEESILTISMPKLAKGLVGVGIEEVKEETESEEQELEGDRGKEIEELEENRGKDFHDLEGKMNIKGEEREREKSPEMEEAPVGKEQASDETRQMESEKRGEGKEIEERREEIREMVEAQEDQEHDQIETSCLEQPMSEEDQHENGQEVGGEREIQGKENEIEEGEERENVESTGEERETQREKPTPKMFRFCVPFFAGSAILVSLIVLIIHLIRAQNQASNVRAKRQ